MLGFSQSQHRAFKRNAEHSTDTEVLIYIHAYVHFPLSLSKTSSLCIKIGIRTLPSQYNYGKLQKQHNLGFDLAVTWVV